jgi:hypothetical protein
LDIFGVPDSIENKKVGATKVADLKIGYYKVQPPDAI